MRSSTRKPSIGRVNCKSISAIDTVRNLLYRGAYWNMKRVKPIRWLPRDSSTASTVTASSHHFSLPSYSSRPSRKRKTEMAPIYMGPAVKGCGPQ